MVLVIPVEYMFNTLPYKNKNSETALNRLANEVKLLTIDVKPPLFFPCGPNKGRPPQRLRTKDHK